MKRFAGGGRKRSVKCPIAYSQVALSKNVTCVVRGTANERKKSDADAIFKCKRDMNDEEAGMRGEFARICTLPGRLSLQLFFSLSIPRCREDLVLSTARGREIASNGTETFVPKGCDDNSLLVACGVV